MGLLISVIVPAYNVEQYVDACIESIANQGYRNLEIILVGDGSTDQTAYLCDRWGARDSRVHVIHQSNEGLSEARNRGVAHASGEYFCFVDSDDYVSENLCQRIVECVEEYHPDIVRFGYYLDHASVVSALVDYNPEGMIAPKEAIRRLFTGEFCDYAWNKVYRRELFSQVRYPKGRVFEDIGTTYRLFLKAKTIFCMNEKLYYYRIRKGSLSRAINVAALCDLFEMRMERHYALKEIYPDISELDNEVRAKVARCVVEWSWYDQVNK